MNKILTFIVNQDKKLLLLKGSPNDPLFKKSIWYVVTGGYEPCDNNLENTVKREIKEETNLDATKIIYLNWIFEYTSFGKKYIEYAFITFVEDGKIVLNEENIDYKWCDLDEFIEKIDWFGDKHILKFVLEKALIEKLLFGDTVVDKFD